MFVQSAQSPTAAPATLGATYRIFASSSSTKLNLSSQPLVRHNDVTGETRLVQREGVDLRFSSAQIAISSGGAVEIGNLLEGQADILRKLFDAVGLLGNFSSDLAGEFLSRIQDGLEGLGAGTLLQPSSLDIKIRIQSRSVTVEDGEGGSRVEKSVQKISVKVRFVSLNIEGEVTESEEPVEADIADSQGQLQGLGPTALFDFNGDGKFSFDDIVALADEVFDVGSEASAPQTVALCLSRARKAV